jgi:hypothetical protein
MKDGDRGLPVGQSIRLCRLLVRSRFELEARDKCLHWPLVSAAVLEPAEKCHECAQHPTAVFGLGQVTMTSQVAPWTEDPRAQEA